MNCPKCGRWMSVVDSRPHEDTVRRRRRCKSCGKKLSTYEVSRDQLDFVKKILDVVRSGMGGEED